MKPIVERPSLNSDNEPVACEHLHGTDFGCVWHYHPECEITLVLKGGSERLVGDTISPLVPGDLVFLGPNLPHDYRNQSQSGSPPSEIEAIVVQFLPHLPGQDDFHQHSSMIPMRRLFKRADSGLVVKGETRLTATHIMRHMSSVQGMKRVILLLQLLDLLAHSTDLQEICNSSKSHELSAAPDRITAACAHIQLHLTEPIYVEALAGMVGLSRSAFSRLFKQSIGRTVPQYVNELRISKACMLLEESDLTVGQIAFECGFVSPAHFQRQFRIHRQCAPLRFRSSVRQKT